MGAHVAEFSPTRPVSKVVKIPKNRGRRSDLGAKPFALFHSFHNTASGRRPGIGFLGKDGRLRPGSEREQRKTIRLNLEFVALAGGSEEIVLHVSPVPSLGTLEEGRDTQVGILFLRSARGHRTRTARGHR